MTREEALENIRGAFFCVDQEFCISSKESAENDQECEESIRVLVAAEREACARVADTHQCEFRECICGCEIAPAIRARSNSTTVVTTEENRCPKSPPS